VALLPAGRRCRGRLLDHRGIHGHHGITVRGHIRRISLLGSGSVFQDADGGGGAIREVAGDLGQRGKGLAAGAGKAANAPYSWPREEQFVLLDGPPNAIVKSS